MKNEGRRGATAFTRRIQILEPEPTQIRSAARGA
jgi:hypothetical protein